MAIQIQAVKTSNSPYMGETLWCCCCPRGRTLSATEILVAASFNTAIRRISRTHSEESLDEVQLRYNTFSGAQSLSQHSGCSGTPKSRSAYSQHRRSGEDNTVEMMALVRPLQRHQEEQKMKEASLPHLKESMKASLHDMESILFRDELELSNLEGRSPEYALRECYGSVVVSASEYNDKAVGVLISQLRGIPWLGGLDGLSIQVSSVGSSKSQWLFLPNAKGPEVQVQRELTVKLSKCLARQDDSGELRSQRSKRKAVWHSVGVQHGFPQEVVVVSVWPGCNTQSSFAPLGSALIPLPTLGTSTARVFGLYGDSKVHEDLGSLELSLVSSSTSSSTSSRHRALLVKVLRGSSLKKPSFHGIAKHASKTFFDKGRLDVWCSLGLWIGGERVKKVLTSKVALPFTCDPDFNASSSFFIPKTEQHRASLVIKVHCGRSVHETALGRIVLGPLLYLGTYKHPPLLPLDTSSPPPVYLSHWGRSLNSHCPVTMWHSLTL